MLNASSSHFRPKAAPFWKAMGMINKGWLFALNGKSADAVHTLASAIIAYRSTGATMWVPLYLSPGREAEPTWRRRHRLQPGRGGRA